MTIAEAHLDVFRDSVLERIFNQLPETVFQEIGINILRELKIPFKVWKKGKYTPEMLLRIGYEQEDFDRWDAECIFNRVDAEEIRKVGIHVK